MHASALLSPSLADYMHVICVYDMHDISVHALVHRGFWPTGTLAENMLKFSVQVRAHTHIPWIQSLKFRSIVCFVDAQCACRASFLCLGHTLPLGALLIVSLQHVLPFLLKHLHIGKSSVTHHKRYHTRNQGHDNRNNRRSHEHGISAP